MRIKRLFHGVVYATACLVLSLTANDVRAEDVAGTVSFSWESSILEKTISCKIHVPEDSSAKHPVVVYLKNLPSPRLGRLDDETLVRQFVDRDMMVIEADYETDPRAVAPELLPEIDLWYRYLFETEDHPVDRDWIYVIPEGYDIDRKVKICDIEGGSVGMDVIYPSGNTGPVPLMLQVTSTKGRGKWINQRAYYIYGLLTRGYAGAIMDWNGGQRTAPRGPVFPEKRAARLLRARAKNWNLSGRFGVTGHSKGSSRAGKAAFINEGDWEVDRGPYADQSDRFQAVLLSAGQHAPEFLIEDGFHKPVRKPRDELVRISSLTFLTPDDPPAFLSSGELDRGFRVKQMNRVAARCEEVGVTHRLIVQKGMDHMYNPRPEVIGHIYDFMDYHLRPGSRAGKALVAQAELDRLGNEVFAETPEEDVSEVGTGDPEELQPYLRNSVAWHCDKLDKDVPLNIYYITRGTHSRPWNIGSPVIAYVKNHGEERIGQEPDSSILMHYLNQRYIVITVDFENDPRAVSPFFDEDLHDLFSAIYARDETSFMGRLEPREYRCFFLPAGCRVATDLVFWELDKHGANGTLEYIMDFYNREIADVVTGKEHVSDPSDLTDRSNRPFQYKVAMDIVYPSQARKKVPLVFYTSTQVTRHPNVAPATYRPHMMGFSMRGYAYAILDHCYNPIRRHFWFMRGRFSIDRWNGLACYTAAIRFIRAHADEYNIDGRYIGGMGHSKGQYSITRLSDMRHEDAEEARTYEGYSAGSPEPQPWQGYSSRISVGYQSPGNHSEFITRDYAPTLVSHGVKDSLGRGYRRFFDRMEELDTNHVALLMKGLGHELPYGFDKELGVDRYELVHRFFDQYLKVEEKIAPTVLYITPPDGSDNVSPSDPIVVQFAPAMDQSTVTVGQGVRIVRASDGSSVKGAWTSSRQGARFTFMPEDDFAAGEQYNVIVTTRVKNKVGTPLIMPVTARFACKGGTE